MVVEVPSPNFQIDVCTSAEGVEVFEKYTELAVLVDCWLVKLATKVQGGVFGPTTSEVQVESAQPPLPSTLRQTVYVP